MSVSSDSPHAVESGRAPARLLASSTAAALSLLLVPTLRSVDRWSANEVPDSPPAVSAEAPKAEARADLQPTDAEPAAETRAAASVPASSAAEREPPPPVAAADADTLRTSCDRLADKLGSVDLADCLGADFTVSDGRSVEGQAILVRRYPRRRVAPSRARVLLLGGIHGDEYSSVSIVFRWMERFEQRGARQFDWLVVPVLNPDGLLREKSRRVNARGVDLNRNFPSLNWEADSRDYWVRRTSRDPRRYPGPSVLSEPETRWLANELQRFRPDVIVAIHAPHSVLDFDGPPEPPTELGPLRLRMMGTYPGSLGRYAGVHGGLPVVTVELPSAGIMPTEADQTEMFDDLLDWLEGRFPARRREPPRQAAQTTGSDAALGGAVLPNR